MCTEHSHTCTRQTGWQAPEATTESESGGRAGQGEGRRTSTHKHGPGKTRHWRTQGHAERSEPSMHKQISTSSPVRPEAAQPAADCPAPHGVPMSSACFQGAPGAMSPLMCPAEAGLWGLCCLSRGMSAAAHGLNPCREGTGTSLGLGALQGDGKPLSPVPHTWEQQRWLVRSCA